MFVCVDFRLTTDLDEQRSARQYERQEEIEAANPLEQATVQLQQATAQMEEVFAHKEDKKLAVKSFDEHYQDFYDSLPSFTRQNPCLSDSPMPTI